MPSSFSAAAGERNENLRTKGQTYGSHAPLVPQQLQTPPPTSTWNHRNKIGPRPETNHKLIVSYLALRQSIKAKMTEGECSASYQRPRRSAGASSILPRAAAVALAATTVLSAAASSRPSILIEASTSPIRPGV